MIVSAKYDDVFKELMRNPVILRYFIGDVLGLPQNKIRSVRLRNTFLWKRYRKEKLGILDVAVELNDDTNIDIELQVKVYDSWDKRQLFYLSKLFTEDLFMGQNYSLLKKCVGISILDFNLTEHPKYHTVYRLRDEEGNEFSDILELHVIELKKKLTGQGEIDDWIRLLNAEKKEDLQMIKTKNQGILTAIQELQRMSLHNPLRLRYEAYMKKVRDEQAWRIHVLKEANMIREEGRIAGREEGRIEGREEGRIEGREEGRIEGREEGRIEGREEGRIEGRAEGKIEGRAEGKIEGRAEGKIEGRAEAVLEELREHGEVPEELEAKILSERDVNRLRRWMVSAMKSQSVNEFLERIKEGQE